MSDTPPLSSAPARKALGQHFLFDPGILHRAATAAGSPEGRTVLEIGPGPGGLTRALLDAGARQVIAVEADPRFANALCHWPEVDTERLTVIEGDARKVDFAKLVADSGDKRPAMIVANLPYNVGTPLLVDWLKAGAWRGEMALMFQREVAERICATPNTSAYGRLAVLAQAVCSTHIAFTLPPGAFRPPPKVDSAVAVLIPLAGDQVFPELDVLERVTSAAFGQRRKMLRAALKGIAAQNGLPVVEWIKAAGLEPTARAETIDQAGFRALASGLVDAMTSGR